MYFSSFDQVLTRTTSIFLFSSSFTGPAEPGAITCPCSDPNKRQEAPQFLRIHVIA